MSLLSIGATSVAGYRLWTGDQTTVASAVSAALLESERLLEEELRRRLPSEERTDTFRIWPDGSVYPDAWPITAAAGFRFDARTVFGGVPDSGPFVGVFDGPLPARMDLTWTGGFTGPSGAEPLPVTLEHSIYDLGRAVLETSSALLPVGGGSMSVGDVSVSNSSSGSAGSVDRYVPGLSERVRKWWNRSAP